jgi:DNA-binding CsgD family transcriptional regulator/PAS domain-containing protein
MPNCNMDTKRFSALIDGFYDASADPERWPAAATLMASFFDTESTVIQVRAGGISNIALRATTANHDHAAQQAYATYFYRHDPFVNGWRAIGTPGIFVGHELVDAETLRKSEIYTDYCRRLGVFHFLGAALDVSAAATLMLGIHRPVEREDFTAEHRQRLELVLPHLSRAVLMHRLLAAANLQRRLACEVFGALSVAAIVVDPGYKVVFANQVADRLLKAGDGLLVRQTRLTTRDSRHEQALQQAINRASRISVGDITPPGGALLVRRARKRPLSVLVVPFRRDVWTDGPAGACAIVFANDPDARRPPASATVAALYRLTPAETRLLDALLQGERVAEYADRAGISTNTANTQLKQIFAKTETNRQAELMRQVLSDPIASLMKAGSVGEP